MAMAMTTAWTAVWALGGLVIGVLVGAGWAVRPSRGEHSFYDPAFSVRAVIDRATRGPHDDAPTDFADDPTTETFNIPPLAELTQGIPPLHFHSGTENRLFHYDVANERESTPSDTGAVSTGRHALRSTEVDKYWTERKAV
ncbi:MAG: hypothetical protein M3548_07165 [Actinomycetota bacterium]|nr:hypothetical protein [Actinomycetota bacterium]